jgi:hypothetical protein
MADLSRVTASKNVEVQGKSRDGIALILARIADLRKTLDKRAADRDPERRDPMPALHKHLSSMLPGAPILGGKR